VLKSSGSSFENFVRDEFTTLAEVDDRIFSTAVDMTYTFPPFALTGVDGIAELGRRFAFEEAATKARRITLDVFATDDSASVQVREAVLHCIHTC
jgi:urate oxidase